MTERWYNKSIKQAEALLKTDINTGLSRDIVKKRRKRVGSNEIYPAPRTSFLTYLKHMLTDFISILLLCTIIIAMVFEKETDLLMMATLLLIYYIIAILTYIKAQRVLEGMGRYALPNAKVMRGGKLYMIKQKQLVQGDVIYLSAGDIVPADARIVECENLEVLEVSITTVPHAVKKDCGFIEHHDIAPAQQKNMLFASTILTKGTAKAMVCATGDDSLICKMKKNVPIVSHERLKIFDSIGKFCKKWTLCMSALIFVLTVIDLSAGERSRGLFEIFLTGLSLTVASMSEFYTAFAYIVLACGIFNAVKKNKDVNSGALIKNSAKLEDIKDISCIIVPKDGAFSLKNIFVEKVFANGETYKVGEHGFIRNCSQLLRYALISTGLYGAARLVTNNQRNENIYSPEEEAIISIADKYGLYNIGLERKYPMVEHIPKGGDCRFETTLVEFENTHVVVVRGEYAPIISNCRFYTENGRIYELTPEKRNELMISAGLLSKETYRIIAVASKDTIYNNLKRLITCQSDMTFEGFIAIKEPMLKGAAETVSKCISAGIKVIMLCDDNGENNRYLAETLGITDNENQVINAAALSKMREDMFRVNIDIYRVYQGLNIAQKRLLVRYLQDSGEKVAVLGSELDDIILLKEADVGYANSITISDKAGRAGIDLEGRNIPVYTKTSRDSARAGCEALKFVSDIIISEADKSGTGGFNAIIQSILCSKVIYLNLYRMLKYMITSQFAKLFIVFSSVITGTVMLTPVQILFCGLIVDFAAIIIIAFEKPTYDMLYLNENIGEKLIKPFMSNIQSVVIGLFWGVLTVLMPQLLMRYGLITSGGQIATCVFFSFLLTQTAILNESKKEKSIFIPNVRFNGIYLWTMVIIAAFIAAGILIAPFAVLFNITSIPVIAWCGIMAVPVSMLLVFEIYKLIVSQK